MQGRSGPLRPLLPATAVSPAAGAQGQAPGDRLSRSSKRARHHGTSRVACDACRARKIACDALRPTCTTCKTRDLECVYTPRLTASEEERQAMDAMRLEIDDLRQRLDDSDEVVSMLRSTSETRAIELLRGLRSTPDIATFLMQVGSKRLSGVRGPRGPSLVASNSPSNPSPPPPSQSSLEFELMMRHAIAYPTLHPIEANRIDLQQLFNLSRSSLQGFEEHSSLVSSASSEPEARNTTRHGAYDAVFRPWTRATQPSLCDQRLSQLQISKWTDVPITNTIAAAAISLYLEVDHPILGLFDDDLFLNDLIAHKRDFCSPLLVCALLCSSLQAYSYFEPGATELSVKFWDRAEELWTDGQEAPLLTTVAATQFMSIAALCHGKDAQGLFYMKKGVAMGKRMGLFGVSKGGSAQEWLDNHVNWIRAASQTAWGVFNWVTFRCLHYRTGQIETPPHLPIPGDSNDKSEKTAMKEQSLPLPQHIGKSFTAMCHFWTVIHDVIWAYYDSEDFVAPASRAHFEFAEEAYQRLLHWADNLPLDLARSSESAHHVVLAHIYLHASISDIFRPFLQGPMRFHNMASFTSQASSPETAFLASSHQLKCLLLVYRARFSSADYCFLWHTALLYVANEVLRKQTLGIDLEWELWFRLCLSGYRDLFRCFKMAKVIYRGLLSMAMRNGVMTATDAQEAIEQLDVPPIEHDEIGELGSMIVDLDLAMTDPLAAQAGILAEQFKDLALFDEFTVTAATADGPD